MDSTLSDRLQVYELLNDVETYLFSLDPASQRKAARAIRRAVRAAGTDPALAQVNRQRRRADDEEARRRSTREAALEVLA